MTGAIGVLASFKAVSHVLRAGFLFKGILWKCMITPAALALYNSLLQPGVMQSSCSPGCLLFHSHFSEPQSLTHYLLWLLEPE